MAGINGLNGNVGGIGKAGSPGMSLDGIKAMKSIKNALGEMRIAMAREMDNVNGAIGRDIFGINKG